MSREPLFLNRTGVLGAHGKGELSYVCVPVTVGGRTVGTLGVAMSSVVVRRFRCEVGRAVHLGATAGLIGAVGAVGGWVNFEFEKQLRPEWTESNVELARDVGRGVGHGVGEIPSG